MPLRRPTVIIHPDSPRAAAWREIFGDTQIPVASPLPVSAIK